MCSSKHSRPRFVLQRTNLPDRPFRVYDRRTRQRICFGSNHAELTTAVAEMNQASRRQALMSAFVADRKAAV